VDDSVRQADQDRRRAVRPEAVGPTKAARLLDVSESTIRRLIKSGKLKATRYGRQWRILLSDLRQGSQN
jgi:excisionase family DNA binding protein